jgi:glutamyl-tRNA reductase
MPNKPTEISNFFIAGINYKKTDASVRGNFAINQKQYHSILDKATLAGIKELFVLSTCNRTEIYGIANTVEDLTALLCSETSGSIEAFRELSYTKGGMDAVAHLFDVAAGLDSQILGDYEIVGQIKQAVKFSKENGFISTYFERLTNAVLQSSKAIKSQTKLSGGTVSVSFAAVQFIRDNAVDIKNKKILLIGTGKIGRNTCKNLIDYLETKKITLLNRTADKAFLLADEMGLRSSSYENFSEEIEDADIIIVATNAEQPIILKNDLLYSKAKVLIDLSIPNNIDPAAKSLLHITLVNVDDLSKINDATLKKREAEVPKAKNIIAVHIAEFLEWHEMRKHVPVLKAVKQKLNDMYDCAICAPLNIDSKEKNSADAVQKAINNMAVKMRVQHQPGCNYIEAINDFLESHAN